MDAPAPAGLDSVDLYRRLAGYRLQSFWKPAQCMLPGTPKASLPIGKLLSANTNCVSLLEGHHVLAAPIEIRSSDNKPDVEVRRF
jgi:hypothetical protein